MNTAKHAIKQNRFWYYVSTRYPLPLHLFYGVIWYLAISGTHAAIHGMRDQWQFSWLDLFGTLSATTLFFFMRTIDEIKDVEYDRLYKPDRALVQGLVTPQQMARYAAAAGVILFAGNALLSWTLAVTVLLIMSYSVFLLWFERAVPAFEDTLYLNTAVSVQLKSGAVAYVFLFNGFVHGGEFTPASGLLIVAFVCGYMHWEMGRKIALPQFVKTGEKNYSTAPGVLGSQLICLALLAVTCSILYVTLEPWRPENSFHGLEWLPISGLFVSAIGMVFVHLKRNKKFPLGMVTQVSYAFCFLYGVIFQTHQDHLATKVALAAPLLFLFNQKILRVISSPLFAGAAWVQLKIFKGLVHLTAAVARSPFHQFSKWLMRALASINCMLNKGRKQDSLPAAAQEWKRMFPIDQNQMPITKVTNDTVFMEIREPCPLRDTGDVGACNRLMEFDRHLLGKLGAQLVVLRSQAQANGTTICQLALRAPNADVSDLASIYSEPTKTTHGGKL
jgi:hypothetical protein